MARKDTQHLQKLGHSWYVRVKVPRKLQALLKNTHVRKALGTRDLDRANELKWSFVKAIKADFARLLKAPVTVGKSDPHAEEARKYREALIDARAEGEDVQVEVMEDFAVEFAQELERKTGDEKRAKEWYDLATAKTPLLSELLDKWLAGENYKAATKAQHRKALADVATFLGGDKLPIHVTHKTATEFVEDWLRRSGQSYNTQRRKINSLVAFWKWMGRRGYVERGSNPWSDFRLSKVRTPKKTPDKRPYKDEELLRLFGAPPAYEGLADVMVLGLYTGARLDELCSLRMRDVERRGGAYWLTLRTAKGKTPTRTIAVTHSAPSEVLARRWQRAQVDLQLFPTFKPGGYDHKLSWSVSKAFGRYRDALEIPRGTDFHSFRRTFITLMENAGVDPVPLARYVGHTLPTLAFKLYSGGATEKTMLATARLVRYPRKVEGAVASFIKHVRADEAQAA